MPVALFNIVLLILVLFLLVILSWVWPPDSPWAPWWSTSKEKARAACRLAKITKKDHVYELGAGDAEFLLTAVKEYGAKGTGVEIDPLRVFIARLRIFLAKLTGRVDIVKKNFFLVNLSPATMVFVYLIPKALGKLKPKFLSELSPGTKIVSSTYEMDLPLVGQDKKYKLFLYRVPKQVVGR